MNNEQNALEALALLNARCRMLNSRFQVPYQNVAR